MTVGGSSGIAAFVTGVTAAAIGAISGAVIVLGRRTVLDVDGWPELAKLAILAATLAVLVSGRKVPEPVLVFVAALAGLAIYPYLHS